MRGSPNPSPTGRRARNYYQSQAPTTKLVTLTKSLSVSSANPPSAASSRSACRRCRVDSSLARRPIRIRYSKDGIDFGIDRDVCNGDAIDRKFVAVGFGEVEESADVVVLVVGRKETFRFGSRELERRKRDTLAELAGQGEVQVNKLAKAHENVAARFGDHGSSA